jgi:hypothetical protein
VEVDQAPRRVRIERRHVRAASPSDRSMIRIRRDSTARFAGS